MMKKIFFVLFHTFIFSTYAQIHGIGGTIGNLYGVGFVYKHRIFNANNKFHLAATPPIPYDYSIYMASIGISIAHKIYRIEKNNFFLHTSFTYMWIDWEEYFLFPTLAIEDEYFFKQNQSVSIMMGLENYNDPWNFSHSIHIIPIIQVEYTHYLKKKQKKEVPQGTP